MLSKGHSIPKAQSVEVVQYYSRLIGAVSQLVTRAVSPCPSVTLAGIPFPTHVPAS